MYAAFAITKSRSPSFICHLRKEDQHVSVIRSLRNAQGRGRRTPHTSLILQNLQRLIETAGGSVLIRIPLIPGVNDSAADMKAFASVLRGFGKRPKGIELLRYNALAEGKYRIAGMRYESFGQEAQSAGYTALLRDELKKHLPGTDVFFAE